MDHRDGVTRVLEILRGYFAPEAADAIRQQVMRFMNYRRSDQSIDEHLAGYDLPRTRAEPKMEMGAGLSDQFAPILRTSNARFS